MVSQGIKFSKSLRPQKIGIQLLIVIVGYPASWVIDSEAMRARGIIVLVNYNQLVKNIETKQL